VVVHKVFLGKLQIFVHSVKLSKFPSMYLVLHGLLEHCEETQLVMLVL